MVLDPQLLAKVFECIVAELFSIIKDNPKNPKSANDALPNVATEIFLLDGC